MGTETSGWFRPDPARCRSGKHILAEVGVAPDGHCKGCLKEWHRAYYEKRKDEFNARRSVLRKERYVPHPRPEQTQCEHGHVYAVTGRHSDGHCAECRRQHDRRRHYVRNYNLQPSEYDVRLAAQGGVCASCGKPETRLRKGKIVRLTLDHDHVTGENRGLICHKCNVALGMLMDDLDTIRKLFDYLNRYRSE